VVQQRRIAAILKFLSARPYRHPFWCGSLRSSGLIPAITTIILHLFLCVIIIGGKGGWSREFTVEDGAASALAWSSSRTTSSSSESLRMMMLSSPDNTRRPQLRSPKSFQVVSSSREVSRKVSSSLEERSTTGNPSEGSLCSYVGDGGP
jgi:hypothetical protein